MKYQKQPFTSVEKLPAENFFKIHTEAVVQTKAHLAEAVAQRFRKIHRKKPVVESLFK